MIRFRRAPGGVMTCAIALLAFGRAMAAMSAAPAASAAGTTEARPTANPRPIPADPAVRRGVLANGLRYAVMRAAAPAGAISLRLGIDAGSYEEGDDERGFAHLVEHMAFRATRAFPDDAVDGAFASRGVAFGRDINARTGLFSTQFKLDLPHAKPEDLALGLQWLREVADGVVFETGGLDKERGVVLAEMEAAKSSQSLAEEAVRRFQAPDLRSTDRDPLGTPASVGGATAPALRAFYQRWYRPQDALVAAVGDLPVEALEARVKETFGSWRADGPPPVRAPRRPAGDERGLDAVALDKTAILHATEVCRLGAPDPRGPEDIAGVRREALREIWRQILDNRLVDLKSDPANRLIEAKTIGEDNGGDLRATCLVILPVEGGWAAALRAGEREFLRFESAGPTELEVETATDRVRSRLRGAITAAPNRTAADLASSIVDRGLDGEDLVEPRQALKAFDLAVEDLTVADVREAFARDWRGAGPLISVASAVPPAPQAIVAAWSAGAGAAVGAAYADRSSAAWDYDFGAPGSIASRQRSQTGQFTRLVFRNGVRLNFKQTDFTKDGVWLVVRFGTGRGDLDKDSYMPTTVGAAVAAYGGVGKYSYEALGRMFQSDVPQFTIHVGEDAFAIGGAVSTPNLPDQLKVLAAFMSDPGFRPSVDPMIHEAVDTTYRLARTNPRIAAVNALFDAVAPDAPFSLPPKAALGGLTNAMAARRLKPEITGDPIEINLVGDIDEKTAVKLVAATLGALPGRTGPPPRRPDAFALRFPANPPPPIRTTHEGPADKAAALAIWPLYVPTAARRREQYAIDLAAAVFGDELRRRVRVDLGKAYAPEVTADMNSEVDQGHLAASVESYPADIDAMIGEIRAVATRLSRGDITPEALEAARAPLLAQDRQRMAANAHWAHAVSRASLDDRPISEMTSYADVLASLSLAEVKAAAATWLAGTPFIAVAEPAPGAKPTPEAHP